MIWPSVTDNLSCRSMEVVVKVFKLFACTSLLGRKCTETSIQISRARGRDKRRLVDLSGDRCVSDCKH